ncbi:hypothetical protein B296_00027664 [Ensete ventricosum]|uniref:Uncharacterized protein n=1 Tax=Ensete ventricosum TaxID=4639 RepID=A0A426YZP2_ENSVE|nr:hypothetical protein B296_00027664 [Ensete ventricosum]
MWHGVSCPRPMPLQPHVLRTSRPYPEGRQRSSPPRVDRRSKHDATHTESLLEVVQRPEACTPGPWALSHHAGPRASHRDD